MEQQVIDVEVRSENGKGAARKLRATGKIPAILYGHKEQPTALALDPRQLRKQLRASALGRNTVLKLQGLQREVMALIKETQIDPIRRDLLHVDLFEVRATDKVTVDVPLEFEGKPVGVVKGGEFAILERVVKLQAGPLQIPRSVTVNVTALDLGQTIHVGELPLPEGVTFAGDTKLAVASMKAPRSETPAGGGEAGAEGAAAPAAAAKPAAAKPAAAKPAAGKPGGK